MTNRAGRKSLSIFERLTSEILKACGSVGRATAVSSGVPEEIGLLERADYGRPLRRALGRSQVRQLVNEARNSVWPNLNNRSVRLVAPREYTRLWSGLGVQFQLAKLKGTDGLNMLGFYVRKMGGSRLPLICVNTAHHPAAVGATFSHEMGHHLVGRLFNSRKDHAQLLASTAYGEHLNDQEELAADVLVSLGVFPETIARKIFTKSSKEYAPKSDAREIGNPVSSAVLKYMQGRYALDFGDTLPSAKKLQYLAGMIHFAKLRQALLVEYDI